jgi:hypothetical protein
MLTVARSNLVGRSSRGPWERGRRWNPGQRSGYEETSREDNTVWFEHAEGMLVR